MEDKLVTLAILTYAKAQILKNVLENEGIDVYKRQIADLRSLFETADLVKFAKHNPLMNENDANLIKDVYKRQSRESVNINTGERFEIQGHTKVSFAPEPALKDLINKPFSHSEMCIRDRVCTKVLKKVVIIQRLSRWLSHPKLVLTLLMNRWY